MEPHGVLLCPRVAVGLRSRDFIRPVVEIVVETTIGACLVFGFVFGLLPMLSWLLR